MATLKELLQKSRENLLILQEREAKYGGQAPLDLINQIRDLETAIGLLEEAVSRNSLTEVQFKQLKAGLKPLIVPIDLDGIDLDSLKADIPPLPYEPETIEIPAGLFLMGSPPADDIPYEETPQHEVDLPAYRIGKYPVTNQQYAEFVSQTGYLGPKKVGWLGKTPPRKMLDHPVVAVSWFDALAYCQWLSEKTGRPYRLPTEAEWEKAARGTDGRIYPWGDEWDAGRCNCSSSQTTAVIEHESGQSSYGCYDMVGNVWEWTSTLWGPDWQESDFAYPYQSGDGREDLNADDTIYRIFRGGSFSDELSQLRCSARRWYAPQHVDKGRGFRVVLEINE